MVSFDESYLPMPKRPQGEPDRSADHRPRFVVPKEVDDELVEAMIEELGPYPWIARETRVAPESLRAYERLTGKVDRQDVRRCIGAVLTMYSAALENESVSPRPAALLRRLEAIQSLAAGLADELAGMSADERKIAFEEGLTFPEELEVSSDDFRDLFLSLPPSGGPLQEGRLQEGSLAARLRLLAQGAGATRSSLDDVLRDRGGKASLSGRRYGSPLWDLAHMAWGLVSRHPLHQPSATADGPVHTLMMATHEAVTRSPETETGCLDTLKRYANARRSFDETRARFEKLVAEAGLDTTALFDFIHRPEMRSELVRDKSLRAALIGALHERRRYGTFIDTGRDPR